MPCSASHEPSWADTYDGPLSLSRRGRCRTRTRSNPELRSAIASVSETSVAVMVVHSFQAVTREVVEYRRQIEPAPTNHTQVGKVGLPQLVGCGCGLGEVVGGLEQDESRTGDQVVRLQEPIDRGLRDEVLLLVDERHRQLPGRQLWFLERELEHCLGD